MPVRFSLHIIWYSMVDNVQDAGRSQTAQNPADIFPHGCGDRTGKGVAEGTGGSRTACDRKGPVARAMAVAGGYAAVSRDGRRLMGSPDRPAIETNGACAPLRLPRTPGGAPRIHQEDEGYAA